MKPSIKLKTILLATDGASEIKEFEIISLSNNILQLHGGENMNGSCSNADCSYGSTNHTCTNNRCDSGARNTVCVNN